MLLRLAGKTPPFLSFLTFSCGMSVHDCVVRPAPEVTHFGGGVGSGVQHNPQVSLPSTPLYCGPVQSCLHLRWQLVARGGSGSSKTCIGQGALHQTESHPGMS